MAFESDERASALASCRRAVEEQADHLGGPGFGGMLGRLVSKSKLWLIMKSAKATFPRLRDSPPCPEASHAT